MAFNSTSGRAEYTASSGQTVFPFLFKIFLNTDIEVYLTPSGSTPNDTADLLTLTTDYTVSINGDDGGSITLVSGASVGDTIVLKRNLPIQRDVDYQTSGDLLAETLNADQEYQTYLVLDGDTNDERSIRLPATDTSMTPVLPSTQAGYGLFVNQAGTAFEYRPADLVGSTLQAYISEAEALTSESYAVEAEDVNVKTYESDGDGTFTATTTSFFSSFHWAQKAAASAATNNLPTLTSADVGKYIVVNSTFDGYDLGGILTSGTYTPTITNLSPSLTSVTPLEHRWFRIGDIIFVSGRSTATITDTINELVFDVSLPIASSFSVGDEVAGTCAYRASTSDGVAYVTANTTTEKATVRWYGLSTNSHSMHYNFSYRVI